MNCRLVQMYWNASEQIANLKTPLANGRGPFASQHTGSQVGAVNLRASQTFAKNRSARTGGCVERSTRERVRCPDPPQMSIARSPGFSTVRAIARTTAFA